jgi:hypothetical protein
MKDFSMNNIIFCIMWSVYTISTVIATSFIWVFGFGLIFSFITLCFFMKDII